MFVACLYHFTLNNSTPGMIIHKLYELKSDVDTENEAPFSCLTLSLRGTPAVNNRINITSQETSFMDYRVRNVLLISQQWIGIFIRKFTRLFLIHIYLYLPNYVTLLQYLTQLCNLKRDSPRTSVPPSPAPLVLVRLCDAWNIEYSFLMNINIMCVPGSWR